MNTIELESECDADGEQRRHQRHSVRRPAKFFDPQTGKYTVCATCDLSIGGALLEVDHAMPTRPGDEIHLAIAQKRRQPLLRRNEMIRASVVRTLQDAAGRTFIGVAFPPATALPLASHRLAA
jgi:hypothetical protein